MKLVIMFGLIFVTVSLQAAIPKLEEKSFLSLLQAASNRQLSMTDRWQSLVRAGQIAKSDEIVKIQEFAKSSDWYMRNASLVALESINVSYGMDQAKALIQDKALVVRSAAVTMLSKKNTLEIRQLLAAELSKPYNFSGKQSLWIRSQIMQQMAKTATQDDRRFLARHLFDTDSAVAKQSADALEKISSVQFSGLDQVRLWQNHVKKNGWL